MLRSVTPLAALAILGCGSLPAVSRDPAGTPPEDRAAAPAPATAASGPAEPPPPAPAIELRARYAVAHAGDFTHRGSWVSSDEVQRVGTAGLELLPESAAIARALADAGDAPEVRLHEGHRWVLSAGSFRSARTLRIDGAASTPVSTSDLVLGVAPLGDGREVWIVARPPRGVQRIAILDAAGRLADVPMPAREGPDVPGLSELASPHCAEPAATRIAGDGASAVVLVTECHVDAPTRLVRFAPGAASPAIRRMPPIGFAPEVMAVLPDGRVVIAGASPATTVIEQPDGTWDARRGAFAAVTITSIAIGADGAIWLVALGQGPDGHDRWVLERDGAEVPLPSVAGEAYRPAAIARHDEMGVVVVGAPARGWSPGATSWLFSER